jgi:hypothetical protein
VAGPPVSIGCAVMVTPGVAGPPDQGIIVAVTQSTLIANGLPLATAGSTICSMVNSVSGVPYPLSVGAAGTSTGVTVDGQGLLRVGDLVPSGSGVLVVLGPPAAPFVIDGNAP